jgi:HSP20 family protein
MAEPTSDKAPEKSETKEGQGSPTRDELWPFEGLRRQVDRLFDDFQRGHWRVPFGRGFLDVKPFWSGQVTLGATPAVDVVETDDGYKVTAELPGIDPKNIELAFSSGTLTIKGHKEEAQEEKKKDYFLSERRYGSFERSIRVADNVDQDQIQASFQNGVLSVMLPKRAEAKKMEKKIEIKTT